MSEESRSGKYQAEIPLHELNTPLVEDEHGYVDPYVQSARISKDIVMQLPSHNFDLEEAEEMAETHQYGTQCRNKSLKRSETRYKTMKMKRVTIRSSSLDDDVEKVYELLTSDPDMEDDEIRSNLREMHQSLTLKRLVKAKIDTESENRNRLKPLDCWSRFSCRVAMWWHKFVYTLKDLTYSLELWHTHIKKIQGHFGTGVASYFVFLRWLLYLNIFNFVLSFGFIVLPHLIDVSSSSYGNDSDFSSVKFSGYDILTGSGWIGSSAFYYGRYTNETIEVSEGFFYNIPYAYLFTVGVAAVVNLFVVAYSVTRAYQANYVHSSGEVKNKVCGKIFCAWDYSIEKPDTAELRHRLIYHELKATLSSEIEKQESSTICSRILKFLDSFFVNIFVMCVIGAIGYLVYYILDSRAVEVKIRILKKMTLALTITAISFFFHYLISYATSLEYYFTKKTQLYLTLSRVAALRIVILGVLVYFWMVIYVPGPGDTRCYETLLGEEIYRLIVVNFLPNLLLCTFFGEFARNMLRKVFLRSGKSMQKAEFDIAYNTNDLIYYQTLVWVGAFYGPMLPLLLLIILVFLFYVKMQSLFYNCRPSQKPWSAMEVQAVFLILALTNFLLAAMAVGYVVFRSRPSATCGPFRGHETMYGIIADSLRISKEENVFLTIVYKYAGSPAFLLAIVIAAGTAVYWAKRYSELHEKIVKRLRRRLVMESKDKVFLLRLFESAYREHMKKCGHHDNPAPSGRGDADNKVSAEIHVNHNGSPQEFMNQSYIDYHQQSVPGNQPCSPNPKTKYNPGYLLADVPVNKDVAQSNFDGSSGHASPGDRRRSSGVQRLGKDSGRGSQPQNVFLPENAVLPRPAHKQGFQYLVRDDIPPRFVAQSKNV